MANPTIKARNLYVYQNITSNERTPIASVADASGASSITNKVVYWDGSGVPQVIFVPAALATSPRMAASRDYAYFADGVSSDLTKWNIATGSSNWGIAAPTTPLQDFATSSTSASWAANTVFSTMGMIVDSGGNAQQLVSVNADGSNPNNPIGTSGVGQPSWNNTPGGTTTDGTETWKNNGPVGLWYPSTVYNNQNVVNGSGGGTVANPAIIYDPITNAMYMQIRGSDLAGTSGTTRPGFSGGIVTDGTCKWAHMGGPPFVPQWTASTFIPKSGNKFPMTSSAVLEPVTIEAAYDPITQTFLQPVWVQYAGTTGTTGASYTHPFWSTTIGQYTIDAQLKWLCLGSATFVNNGTVVEWNSTTQTNFTVVKDSNGNIQICIAGGTNGAGPPIWGTTYGAITTDGAVKWSCVGNSLSWVALTKYFDPAKGFIPPQTASAYGGATIVDSNKVYQSVTESGKSGTVAPTWNAVGNTTTDNAITWFAVAPVSSASGAVTLKIGRRYYVVFINFTSQTMSDLSPESAITGPLTGGQIFLSSIPVSADPQVDQKIILATGDGGDPTILYFLAQITNATTTVADDTPEETLILGNIYQEQDLSGNDIGVLGNQPPPNGSFPTTHRGRMYLAVDPFILYSKTIGELTTSSGIIAGRFETAWPPENALDISITAEKTRGLLSDGVNLYVGTERHIRRIYGDPVLNPGTPDILFSEAGVLTQNAWQIIFHEGTPTGAMWITPDFRCLRSDFNTYINAGLSIQSTLKTINPSAVNNIWATSVSYGPYNFYVVALPTGSNTNPDTLCVYDVHINQWFIWNFAESMLCGLFYVSLSGVPRWLMFSADGTCRYVDPLVVVDKSGDGDAAGITSSVRTTWLHLGDPTTHKILNEIEALTTDTLMTVTVEGASTNANFNSPHVVVSGVSLISNQFGQLKTFLAGRTTVDRFYRFTFASTSTIASAITDILLGYFSIEAQAIHRL